MTTTKSMNRKSPLMLLSVLAVWLVVAIKYNTFLTPLYQMVGGWTGTVLVTLALVWINIVWFYGAFHVLSVVFSRFARRPKSVLKPTEETEVQPVAILYTTCNDFSESGIVSCMQQDYNNYTVFVLDDSYDPEEEKRVTAFCDRHMGKLVHVRRNSRTGFKAGNLNNALRTVARSFTYFAVVDADEILPPDFLSLTIPHFRNNPEIGFVQANHKYTCGAESRFASCLSDDVDLHWEKFLTARNKYGFVMLYGHGAVIRTSVWREVGGFPEVVSEDIAFAASAREHGYYGVFLPEVVAQEAFPDSYASFLRREIKVVCGTLDFIIKHGRSFLLSRRVSLTEKMDLLASAGVLYLPVYFLFFLIVANVILPLLAAHGRAASDYYLTFGQYGWLDRLEPLGAGLKDLWSWDFYVVTVISILSPLVYQIDAMFRSPFRVARYAAHSTAVYLSAIPSVVWAIISSMRRVQPQFVPTGDRRSRSSIAGAWKWFTVTLGAILLISAFVMGNYALLTVALSFLLQPVLLRFAWNSAAMRLIVVVPFLFFAAVFGSIPFLLIGVTGALAAAVPAHH